MSEWREVEINEIIDMANTGLDAIKRAPIVENDTGIKCMRIQDVSQNKSFENWGFTDVEEKNYKKFQLKKNDIIIARTGATVGVNRFIYSDLKSVFNNGLIRIRVDHITCLSKFLYYHFRTDNFYSFIESISGGTSSQPNMQINVLLSYAIQLPPLPEQKAIAEVLSSLDDKIDLLHRQNKTLEQMAETLFRQWFVEEAGEDWEEGMLGDVAVNVRSSVKISDIQEDMKYVGLEHIDRRNITLNNYGFGGEVNSNKSAFETHDILFGKLRPYFHKVCFASFSGICSTDILVLRPKQPEYFFYCLFVFFQNDVVEYANLGSGGTRMPRTNWSVLKQYPIAIPNVDAIVRFNEIVEPAIKKITYNINQIRTLENLRDTLLPKLMTGEVRIASNG